MFFSPLSGLHAREVRPARMGLGLACLLLAACGKTDPRDAIPRRQQEGPPPNVLSPVVVTGSGEDATVAPDSPAAAPPVAPETVARDTSQRQRPAAPPPEPDAAARTAVATERSTPPVTERDRDATRDAAVRMPAPPAREPAVATRPAREAGTAEQAREPRGSRNGSDVGGSTAGVSPAGPPIGGPRELNARAITLINQDRPTDAIVLLEQAVRLKPHDPELLGNLGYAYMRSGQYGPAREHLLASRDASPRRSATWLNLGQTYAELGDPELAVRMVLTGYELSSRRESVRLALATAATSGRQSRAWSEVARISLEQINDSELGPRGLSRN